MYVLGISCYYHDASAALLKDGRIVAAAEEERFTRVKHDFSFPENAVKYCLQSEGITIDQVEYVGFYEKPLLKLERFLYQNLDSFPFSLKTFVGAVPAWLTEKAMVREAIRKRLKYKGKLYFVEHHLAHAASAFLVSPFSKAAIVTLDGVGEWTTTAYGKGDGTEISLDREISFPSSIGLLYSTITAYLGFSVNNSEYKVMGLAAYGNMDVEKNPYYQKLLQMVDIKEDGSYRLDMKYFSYVWNNRMPSEKMCDLLGGKPRKKSEPITERHKDIAAALQLVTEEIITRILHHAHKETECDDLVLAGGVALNSVYNGKIIGRTKFKRVWIQPNSSDGGTSIGTASLIYHSLLGHPRNYVMETAYLGPDFTDAQVQDFLDTNEISYHKLCGKQEIVMETARLIYENNVVGWFQGRMEWGPRALGARSILSNPCNPHMQEILNLKVKHREKFRPFAPVVCVDDALDYFECDSPIPSPTDFMLMVYPVREKWREKIPAVTHVDGSGRLQTVRREQNPLYYEVIKEFGRLSGIPILINTSFNIRGEPIVCTPYDAYKCMMGTGIDYLVIGSYLIARDENACDGWDSEKNASD